jgi:hypothetical protein
MNPAIQALKHDLISLFQALLMSGDDASALIEIEAVRARIEAALLIVEVRT